MKHRLIFSLLVVGLLTAVAGCNSPGLPELSPEELVHNAADRMNELAGFKFDITREGAPAYLDPDEVLSFRRAAGSYVAPDKARATVRVIGPAIITDVEVISIAETQWQTNFATGAWEELPPNWGFNPAILFDENVGLPAILTTDFMTMQLGEPQNLADAGGPDQLLYYLTGELMGEKLYEMSGTLIGPEPVSVEVWVAPETFELIRVIVTEPVPGAEEPSIWQLDFSNFDEVIEIEPPLLNN